MSLSDFFRKKDERIDDWNEADIIQETGDKISFRYHLMDRSDISKISIIQNVLMGQDQIMIETYCPGAWTPKTKVLIGGYRYSFVMAWSRNAESQNNPFGAAPAPDIWFVQLRKPANG